LFENLYVRATDVGHTFTVGPGDPDFANFAAYLTDGQLNYCDYWMTIGSPHDAGVAGSPAGMVTEANFFADLPPGNNGIDLGGFDITQFTLRFDALQIASPGSNPNGDGVLTDYSLSSVFSVYGQAIPEPSSTALLWAIALAYGLVTRTRPNLTVQSMGRPKAPFP
jgi:hypothetical protein